MKVTKMKEKFTLREAREKLGVTQQEFADMLGITRTYVGLVENGSKPFSEKLNRKLLKVIAEKSTDAAAHSEEAGQEHQIQSSNTATQSHVVKPPSPEAMELLHRLYDLARDAGPMYSSAHLNDDKPTAAVAGLVINIISLVKSRDSDTRALGKIATIVMILDLAMAGDYSQIDLAKQVLDGLNPRATKLGLK